MKKGVAIILKMSIIESTGIFLKTRIIQEEKYGGEKCAGSDRAGILKAV